MLIYALLYLTGYEAVTIGEIKRFRQLGSLTPGHPENFVTAGIETTTGPLGQGISNAVGMAIAERHLAAEFGSDVVDHTTYVLASDGDLMEGISQEAIALAGHLKLNKLIVLFDDNGISIDGPLSLADSVDQVKRFEAAGWAASRIDGHDADAIAAAIAKAQASDKPTLIACKTTIAFGAPTKAGKSSSHGSPLGPEEIAGARKALGWDAPPFVVPDDILSAWRTAGRRSQDARSGWAKRLAAQPAEQRSEFERRTRGDVPKARLAAAVQSVKEKIAAAPKDMATRAASEFALESLVPALPELIGGSADLTGSNNTKTKAMTVLSAADYGGRFIHYGIREHGMAAAMNGMAVHGGVIPYSGTFLVFSDYCRPSIRLAALMEERVIHVMTHDSIGLGEDGPTHQPVEHLASLRAIPGLNVVRPADANETVIAWREIQRRWTKEYGKGAPHGLALTRQGVPVYERNEDAARGGYVLQEAEGGPARVVLIGTGSEVQLAVAAREQLQAEGVPTRVVSMPCVEWFDQQDQEYRDSVLPPEVKARVAVEAGIALTWYRFVGDAGRIVSLEHFGASADAKVLFREFGFTPEAVAAAARESLAAADR
jgi:transketolase